MPQLKNHNPEEYIERYNDAENDVERHDVRTDLKRLDSGRWYDVLNATHKHLAHADIEAAKNLKEIYGEEFRTWIGVFGLVEDLNTMPDFTGVERER